MLRRTFIAAAIGSLFRPVAPAAAPAAGVLTLAGLRRITNDMKERTLALEAYTFFAHPEFVELAEHEYHLERIVLYDGVLHRCEGFRFTSTEKCR